MGYGALILATIVVAGFIFVLHYPPARYNHKRSEGWHTYLHAGAWGIPFAFVSFLMCFFVQWLCGAGTTELGAQPSANEPFVIGFSFLTPALAWLSGKFVHCLYYGVPRITHKFIEKLKLNKGWHSWVIEHNNKAEQRQRLAISETVKHDPFEKLIVDSTNSFFTVMVTLKSRKVYIGQITNSGVEHGKLEHISIIPIISGYRKEDDFRLIRTVNYADMYKTISPSRLDEFSTVIPVSEIESTRLFDDEIYEGFQELHTQKGICLDGSHI